MFEPRLLPLGDHAVSVKLSERPGDEASRRIRAWTAYLEEHPFAGMVEVVPGMTTLAVYYDPLRLTPIRQDSVADAESAYDKVCGWLRQIASGIEVREHMPAREVKIPVCYGGRYGPDLDDVAASNGLTAQEVIHIHSGVSYTVYMLGFAPGFPYLSGMDGRIAAPRKATPQLVIDAGSVGIAGEQTGIYPIQTPGGWNIIGRTPLALFTPDTTPPTLLRAGDVVRFRPITPEQYLRMEADR